MEEQIPGVFIKQEDETGYSVIIKQEVNLSDFELEVEPENGDEEDSSFYELRTRRSVAEPFEDSLIGGTLGSANGTIPKQDPKTDSDDDHPNETPQERKRRLGRQRSARYRAAQSEAKLIEIRAKNALKKRLERQRETPDEAAARRLKDALNKKNRVRKETPEQAEARRRKTALYMKKARQGETAEQTAARRLRDASNKRKCKQDEDYIKIELDPLEDLDEQIFRYAEITSEPSSTSLLNSLATNVKKKSK